jgi:hypothetical protein
VTYTDQISADGEQRAVHPGERSHSFSQVIARRGLSGRQLWALNEVDRRVGFRFAAKCGGIKKGCKHD